MPPVDSAQDAAQGNGLDAGLNESDANLTKEEIGKLCLYGCGVYWLTFVVLVHPAQDTDLDESAKNKTSSKLKMTFDVNDTAGFMAAARARFYDSGPVENVASSKSGRLVFARWFTSTNIVVVNSAQDIGLDESAKVISSSNEIGKLFFFLWFKDC